MIKIQRRFRGTVDKTCTYSFWMQEDIFDQCKDSLDSLNRCTDLSEAVVNETTEELVKCRYPLSMIVDGFFANQATLEDMYS